MSAGVSIYGGSAVVFGSGFGFYAQDSTPNIYGGAPPIDLGGDSGADQTDCQLAPTTLPALVELLVALEILIQNIFPENIFAQAPNIINITAYAAMPPPTFVRFVWINRHPGIVFYPAIHNFDLRDIYLEYNISWQSDPIISTMVIPAGSGGTDGGTDGGGGEIIFDGALG
jgi:hypothetical protein